MRVGPAPRIAVSFDGSGALVLFLHGIGGNRRNWFAQVDTLAANGFKAAAWDARGYGDSDDYEGPLDFREHFVGDVLRVADHFGAGKLHLVGLSMGGRIARNVALHSPQRLYSLTLVSASPGFNALSPQAQRRFVAERQNRTPDTIRRLLGSEPRAGAYEELLESLGMIREASYRKTLEASVAQDRDAPIENIRVPTCIIAGEQDSLYPPEIARAMAQRIAGAELVMMPGAGHLVNLEQPERFNAILLGFLARHAP